MKTNNPATTAELQEAVDLADFYLHLHSAVLYGLVSYSGKINVERCEEIMAMGKARSIFPRPGSLEEIARQRVGES
jgi:hypothetical protein